jgi:DNA adenine methylase
MSDKEIHKPFLKWVGGKTQIIKKILEKIPTEIHNYHEPFLGGGSVLLAVLSTKKIKGKIIASDINKHLINLYIHIQKDKDNLYSTIQFYTNEFKACLDIKNGTKKPHSLTEAMKSRESYYYYLRQKFNYFTNKDKPTKDDNLIISALFLILNKTCFRGVYREGPHGFNVPYGHPKTFPTIILEEKLNSISSLIKDVKFLHQPYTFTYIKQGDFVYFDPPYAPIAKDSFVKYTRDDFKLEDHNTLFKSIIDLDKKGVKFLLSNAKVDLVTTYFKDFNTISLVCKRAIHSKNPGKKAEEVLITNL